MILKDKVGVKEATEENFIESSTAIDNADLRVFKVIGWDLFLSSTKQEIYWIIQSSSRLAISSQETDGIIRLRVSDPRIIAYYGMK